MFSSGFKGLSCCDVKKARKLMSFQVKMIACQVASTTFPWYHPLKYLGYLGYYYYYIRYKVQGKFCKKEFTVELDPSNNLVDSQLEVLEHLNEEEGDCGTD